MSSLSLFAGKASGNQALLKNAAQATAKLSPLVARVGLSKRTKRALSEPSAFKLKGAARKSAPSSVSAARSRSAEPSVPSSESKQPMEVIVLDESDDPLSPVFPADLPLSDSKGAEPSEVKQPTDDLAADGGCCVSVCDTDTLPPDSPRREDEPKALDPLPNLSKLDLVDFLFIYLFIYFFFLRGLLDRRILYGSQVLARYTDKSSDGFYCCPTVLHHEGRVPRCDHKDCYDMNDGDDELLDFPHVYVLSAAEELMAYVADRNLHFPYETTQVDLDNWNLSFAHLAPHEMVDKSYFRRMYGKPELCSGNVVVFDTIISRIVAEMKPSSPQIERYTGLCDVYIQLMAHDAEFYDGSHKFFETRAADYVSPLLFLGHGHRITTQLIDFNAQHVWKDLCLINGISIELFWVSTVYCVLSALTHALRSTAEGHSSCVRDCSQGLYHRHRGSTRG
jgi:hypothetical protein